MGKVILFNQINDFLRRIRLFYRHQRQALLMERRMQADCQMAIALFQKTFQSFYNPNRGDGYPFGTPAISIRRCEDFKCFEQFFNVIQWFSHPHKDQIGQRIRLRKRLNLIQDLIGGKIGCESLFACHTEQTIHLTAYLRRNT